MREEEIHELTLSAPFGHVRLDLVRKGRVFEVRTFEPVEHPDLCVAFLHDVPGFENLDKTSDVAQCFNLSTQVRYDNVTLGTLEMRANSIEELVFVLKKAKFRVYNPEAI